MARGRLAGRITSAGIRFSIILSDAGVLFFAPGPLGLPAGARVAFSGDPHEQTPEGRRPTAFEVTPEAGVDSAPL